MEKDLAVRFPENPLLSPADLPPSHPGMQVIRVLNPSIFEFEQRRYMLVQVEERPVLRPGFISIPQLSYPSAGRRRQRSVPEPRVEILFIDLHDPELSAVDSRSITYRKQPYSTFISHFRLLRNEKEDGFLTVADYPYIYGKGMQERFGLASGSIMEQQQEYTLSYGACGEQGNAIGMMRTRDWKSFYSREIILPPQNRHAVLFQGKINGLYYLLHCPMAGGSQLPSIWIASSPDGLHWGNHFCLLRARPGEWDCDEVGPSASPVFTEKGWLGLYFGRNQGNEYAIGAFLLDLQRPEKILARTRTPLMLPHMEYEQAGLYSKILGGSSCLVRGDEILLYYAASGQSICGARISISAVMQKLIYG